MGLVASAFFFIGLILLESWQFFVFFLKIKAKQKHQKTKLKLLCANSIQEKEDTTENNLGLEDKPNLFSERKPKPQKKLPLSKQHPPAFLFSATGTLLIQN